MTARTDHAKLGRKRQREDNWWGRILHNVSTPGHTATATRRPPTKRACSTPWRSPTSETTENGSYELDFVVTPMVTRRPWWLKHTFPTATTAATQTLFYCCDEQHNPTHTSHGQVHVPIGTATSTATTHCTVSNYRWRYSVGTMPPAH